MTSFLACIPDARVRTEGYNVFLPFYNISFLSRFPGSVHLSLVTPRRAIGMVVTSVCHFYSSRHKFGCLDFRVVELASTTIGNSEGAGLAVYIQYRTAPYKSKNRALVQLHKLLDFRFLFSSSAHQTNHLPPGKKLVCLSKLNILPLHSPSFPIK
jgi:hypothetical protein